MADETTTATEPVAESAPAEHTIAPVDPDAFEQALEVLAEPQADEPPATDKPKGDEVFEPMGSVGNCP
ncbi:hypothetical protein KNE206_27560 [Kitasatospora sp. NE20-6]|uniref:hypothetical protein n=1 Tax=Kitasatospora sp. NE20-6 TaxID=2859066 RepID=UPI0034DBE5D6